jgi:phosphatidylserine/phosphatidylglycerophosphate/cardiolipin synthase-like enzyme
VVGVVMVICSGTVTASAYTPEGGARFNDPSGGKRAQDRSMSHIRRTIDSTPHTAIIRIASYSHDRRDITDALIRACRRGVAVQVVLNDNWTSSATRRLRRLVGTRIDPHWDDTCNPRKRPEDETSTEQPYPHPSFVRVCDGGCRVNHASQHIKFYLFSRAGRASNVVMFGSTNTTGFAAKVHWNDLFTLRNQGAMFADYSTVFRELAEDERVADPFRVFRHGRYVTEFGPKPAARTDRSEDPIVQRLAKIRCRAQDGTGIRGRTALRVKMYAWVGDRGRYLARKVANLRRDGCNVRAILSQSSSGVRQLLRRGGVTMRSADLNLDGNRDTGFNDTPWEQFTHEKWMSVNGTWDGRGRRIVWTGSENWSDRSLNNDEMTVLVPGVGPYRAYSRHFEYVWKRHTRRM